MAMGNTLATQVAVPQINTLQNFQASQANAQNMRMAKQQEEAAAFEQLATVGLGVMNGNPDGEIDPARLEQALGMLGNSPLAAKVKENPELLRTITKGSMNVLQFVRDGEKFEMAKKQFEMELANSQKPPAPVEVSAGATMWDPTTKEPVFTAPPAGPSTQIIMPGEPEGGASLKAFQDGLGGIMAKDYGALRDEAKAARASLGTLKVMEDAVSSPDFYSGFGADQILQLKRFSAAVGIDPEGVSDMETFNALNKQAALQAMGGSLGTGFSNADRDFVIEQVPSLANSPEGNKKIIEIQRKIAERKIAIADLATEYVQKNKVLDAGFEAELADWAEKNPLFGDMDDGERTTSNGITYSIGK